MDFRSQNAKEESPKKIRQKIRHPNTKNLPEHEPPKTNKPDQKSRRKIYQQIQPSNLQAHAGFLAIEKVCFWRRLLGMVEAPVLKFACDPSVAAGGRGKGCCAPSQTREVLHGVGADGVGVKFPIFAGNCCCLPLSFRSREKRRKRGKMH